ncbi:acyltransferase [Martelella alba]|uniref:Acyltransferase n=1 Tax=Martelella alba TaxID=2590451 RepID=A0A506UJ42_9HYPH|nr:acyltransferase [Martelella alba]TPW33322.1 acyltransferase [Martelella alba]
MLNNNVIRKNELISIQYLRAIAAIIVVFHHARGPQPWLFNPIEWFGAGAKGVDIFFVISGFVMYFTSLNKRPIEFIKSRINRLVPLYWIFTLIIFLGTTLRDHIFNIDHLLFLIKSMFFVPAFSLDHPGHVWPVLVPGWTLNFEIFFYLIFAFGLFIKNPYHFVMTVIVLLISMGLIFDFSNPLFITYTSPLLVEFLAGMIICRIYLSGKISPSLFPLGPICFLLLLSFQYIIGKEFKAIIDPLCAAGVVIGGLSIEERLRSRPSRVMYELGNASYSIYLCHGVFLAFFYLLFKHMPLDGALQFCIFLLSALFGSIVSGVFVHYYIEKPLTRILKRNAVRPITTAA